MRSFEISDLWIKSGVKRPGSSAGRLTGIVLNDGQGENLMIPSALYKLLGQQFGREPRLFQTGAQSHPSILPEALGCHDKMNGLMDR